MKSKYRSENLENKIRVAKSFAGEVDERLRVLCIVKTSSRGLKARGALITNLWGKRCNKLLFYGKNLGEIWKTAENFNEYQEYLLFSFFKPKDTNLENVISLSEGEDFANLRDVLKRIYLYNFDEFDWILRVQDDSYIVVENLKHLLNQYDWDWPMMVGQRFLEEVCSRFHKLFVTSSSSSQDYIVGNYAFSKAAFVILIEKAFTNHEICPVDGFNSDVLLSRCMQHVDIFQIDAFDDHNKALFLADKLGPALMLQRTDDDNYDKWFWKKLNQGIDNCCSDHLIGVFGLDVNQMIFFEYFIYKVQVFGIQKHIEASPVKYSIEKLLGNMKITL